MLVVMPFCAADVDAAVRNLEWAIELDGTVKHDCLLSYDLKTDGTEVRELAQRYFAKLLPDFRYEQIAEHIGWPHPHNWAFQRLAKHVHAIVRRPFFWWEPDAVPIQSRFLDTIEAEWEKSKKPFMGTVVRPSGHMNGCACYPWNIPDRSVNAMLCRAAPWDVVLSKDINGAIHDASEIMARVVSPNGQQVVIDNYEALSEIIDPAKVVLFHGCRDDTIIRILRGKRNGKKTDVEPAKVDPPEEKVEQLEDVGVVITTHNRERRCQRALSSCIEAGVKEIVITATGRFDPKFEIPDNVTIVHSRWNANSNNAWIAGVKKCKAKRVLILHDDDMVLPEFMPEVSKHLDANFVCFTAKFHREKDSPSFLCVNPRCYEGVLPSKVIKDYLTRDGSFSITPVRGLFKKDDLLKWLGDAGECLPHECYYRSGFLVGNDMWIWLGACQKYQEYYSMATPVVSLGVDSDSTSVSAMRSNELTQKLKAIYASAKAAFFRLEASANSQEQPKKPRLVASLAEERKTTYSEFTSKPVGVHHFYHSGDLGDIIYALPVIKARGVGVLHLGPHTSWPTRELMTSKRAQNLIPLLKLQPYIEDCVYEQGLKPGWTDMNPFRELFHDKYTGRFHQFTLAQVQLEYFNLPEWIERDRWLFVEPVKPPKPVIISRSDRYHDNLFDWGEVVKKYGKSAVFIGTDQEHKTFCGDFGAVEYLPTKDLLDVAQYIAGCELFIGNQSCCFAIAEGLKHPAILEFYGVRPQQNCHFCRPNLKYGMLHKDLPDLTQKKNLNWNVLTDNHSGLGRCAYSFYKMVSREFDVNWVPTRATEEFTNLPALAPTKGIRTAAPTFVLEAANLLAEYVKHDDIVYSMWESTRLQPRTVGALNNARCVIVPCEWCRKSFQDSGVTSHIYKVPLGVNCDVFRFLPHRRNKDALRIGCAFRGVDNGNPRKNVAMMVEGFLKALGDKKDAKLCIKAYGEPPDYTGDQLEISFGFWTDRQMVDWYNSLDVFVDLCSAGGWELHLHEAMACGAIPVALDYSGQTEFFNRNVGYTVDYKLVTPRWGDYTKLGQWAQPELDSYVSVLRYIYNHRPELDHIRTKSIASALEFTEERSGRELVRVLKEVT